MDEGRELMRRLKEGDISALEALILRWRVPAEQYAARILRDPHAAEDAAQEAFARLYASRGRYDEAYAFSTWLFVIVKRVCLDQLRREKRAPLLPGELPDMPAASAEEECLQRLEWRSRVHMLAALDETDRKLLLDFALKDRPVKALAAELGMTEGQVRVRLHRIRKRLKKGASACYE